MKNYNFKQLEKSVKNEIYYNFINEVTDELFNDELFNLSINNNICIIIIHLDLLSKSFRIKENLVKKIKYDFDTNDFKIININDNYFQIIFEF